MTGVPGSSSFSGMKRVAAALALSGALAAAAPAGAQDGAVVADHLNNPRQVEVTPDGVVLVAEAGRGGSKCLRRAGGELCYGFTSSVTRVRAGKVKRVVSGLLSVTDADGNAVAGLTSVARSPFGGLVGTVGGVGEAGLNAAARLQAGSLMRFSPFGRPRVLSRIDAFSGAASDPAGVDGTREALYVADAGAGTLLRVGRKGTVRVAATFSGVGGIAAQPSAVRVGPDGAVYVGLRVSDASGEAMVARVVPGGPPEVYAEGLSSIVGLDFDSDGNLYVAEAGGAEGSVGAIVVVDDDGDQDEIGEDQVEFPGGVAVGPDDAVYVTNHSNRPGGRSGGELLRFDLDEE